MPVPPQAFTPPPKVDSAVVRLHPRKNPVPASLKKVERVTAAAFQQRRKMLRQSLKSLGIPPEELCARAGVEPTMRADQISVSAYLAMAAALP